MIVFIISITTKVDAVLKNEKNTNLLINLLLQFINKCKGSTIVPILIHYMLYAELIRSKKLTRTE